MKNYRSILALGFILTLIIACSPIKESPEPADIKPGDSTSNTNNNTGNADVYVGLWKIKDRRVLGISGPIDSVFTIHLDVGGNGTFTFFDASGNITSTHPTVYKHYITATPPYIDFTGFGSKEIKDKTATIMVWSYDAGGITYEETLEKQ